MHSFVTTPCTSPLPVDGAEGAEVPLHVYVKLAETILSPELHQVDPAAPPRVRDVLEAPHLSIHTFLSHPFPPL